MTYAAIVDLGTSSIRTSVVRGDGGVVTRAQRDITVQAPHPGHAEQDADLWWDAIVATLREAIQTADSPHIDAVTVTNQQITTVPIDSDGRCLAPAIVWMDRRTHDLALELQDYAALVHRTVGLPLSTSWAPLRIMWWRREKPQVHDRARWFLTPDAFAYLRLGGEPVTDPSNACFSLMCLETGDYDGDLAELTGIDLRCLPRISPSGSTVGTVLPEVARATGLSEHTRLMLSGSDQPCAAIAMGATRPGRVTVTAGTGTFIVRRVASPTFDLRLLTNHAAGDGWLQMGVHYVSGAAWRWLTKTAFGDQDLTPSADRSAELECLASQVVFDPGLPIILPYFQGARTPYFDDEATALVSGMTLNTTRGMLAWSLMESNGFGVRDVLGAFHDSGAAAIDAVVLGGAPARSNLWCAIQADAIGVTCLRSPVAEATSHGAALIVLAELGAVSSVETEVERGLRSAERFEPHSDRRAAMSRRFERYRLLYQRTKDLRA